MFAKSPLWQGLKNEVWIFQKCFAITPASVVIIRVSHKCRKVFKDSGLQSENNIAQTFSYCSSKFNGPQKVTHLK